MGVVFFLCAWGVYLLGMAHLAVAADRNGAGELGAGLDLTIAGARWVGASLLPAVVGGYLYFGRRRRPRDRAAPSPPLQQLAHRPGGLSIDALIPWHRPPKVPH